MREAMPKVQADNQVMKPHLQRDYLARFNQHDNFNADLLFVLLTGTEMELKPPKLNPKEWLILITY